MEIARNARIGLVAKGGPVNGPFVAGVFAEGMKILKQMGLKVTALYGNSATVPAVMMCSVGREEECCEIWSRLRPRDIIGNDPGKIQKFIAGYRLLGSESVFSGAPLHKLLEHSVPVDQIFSSDALPVKFPAVSFRTGKPAIFCNKNPEHRVNWIAAGCASMAVVPFLPPVEINGIIYIDGGFNDNLMLDEACADGMDVILIADINELGLGPLESENWKSWPISSQRALHVLITTNDARRYHGVRRTNETLAIREQLAGAMDTQEMPESVRAWIQNVVARMDHGLLGLHDKHQVQMITIGDRAKSIPFDFANFTSADLAHLIQAGRDAATRAFSEIKIKETS